MSPLWGEKPQNRPLGNVNTSLALCAARNAAGKNFQASHYVLV